jgi:signal transduction histidine kinase
LARDRSKRHEDTYVGRLPLPPEPKFLTDEFPAVSVPHLIVFRVTTEGRMGSGQPYAVHGRLVIGRTDDADIVLPADDVSRHHAEISTASDGTFMVTDLDSANGTMVNDQSVKQAVLNPGDKIMIGTSFILLFTRYHPLETQLMQAQKMESLGQLAAGVAHEINNPLAYVYYNLESLTHEVSKVGTVMVDILSAMLRLRERLGTRLDAEGLGDLVGAVEGATDPEALEKAAACLVDSKDGVQRILNIVRDLKTFSRLEEERVAAVNVNDVMEIAAKIAHNEIKLRARLIKDYCHAPLTRANEGRLAQVFLNLLMNAAHAFEGGGPEANTITVRTSIDDDHLVVEVHDTGRGIAPEHLGQVFEPFFTTKEDGLGSGLGLSICHNIVTAYGGTIEVTSERGEGTCFCVRLPRARTKSGSRLTVEHMLVRRKKTDQRARVLVVDDEFYMGMAIKRALPEHNVEIAKSGAEAEQLLLNDQSFDLVLCDLLMPKYSGMDLHRWIERRCPQLLDRVVFMSGGAFTPESIEFAKSAPIKVLDKPIGINVLEDLIGAMLGLRGE